VGDDAGSRWGHAFYDWTCRMGTKRRRWEFRVLVLGAAVFRRREFEVGTSANFCKTNLLSVTCSRKNNPDFAAARPPTRNLTAAILNMYTTLSEIFIHKMAVNGGLRDCAIFLRLSRLRRPFSFFRRFGLLSPSRLFIVFYINHLRTGIPRCFLERQREWTCPQQAYYNLNTFVFATTEFIERRAGPGLARYHVFALREEDGGRQDI
jgi:hypothetical protein